MVADVNRPLMDTGKVVTMSSRVRLPGGPSRRHRNPSPGCILSGQDKESEKPNLDEELPLLMNEKTEEQKFLRTEYFDQNPPESGQADNQSDCKGEEKRPASLRELLYAQRDGRECTQAAQTNGIQKS